MRGLMSAVAERTAEIAAKLASIPVKDNPDPINNSEIVEQFRLSGGQIVHIVPKRRPDGTFTRGVTVAFKKKSGHVEIATAVQHRNDVFTKKMGTKTAIEHFIDGRTINVPAVPTTKFFTTADAIKSYLPFLG